MLGIKSINPMLECFSTLKEAGAYALFRLPDAPYFTLVAQRKGDPLLFHNLKELNGESGFVIAPFKASEEQPIVLIKCDIKKELPLSSLCEFANSEQIPILLRYEREAYRNTFSVFSQALLKDEYQKLVLSRRAEAKAMFAPNPLTLFALACQRYPHQAITLSFTQPSGIWLVASPEVLLTGNHQQWSTVALAGTMPYEQVQHTVTSNLWSPKNREEQQLVADYIAQCLNHYAVDIKTEGPCTIQAGNLVHRSTTFQFTLLHLNQLGSLLAALHPTPAVCGLPKKAAQQFILRHETVSRHYYAGFMGLLQPEADTHLYVSLRCMQIKGEYLQFYAGGGLLKASQEVDEWNETEHKMDTMLSLFKQL
ncbi:MAG: chorismate-binding protein [Bacteroidaceae bacterium]